MRIIFIAILYVASVTTLILTRIGVLNRGKVFFKCLSSMLFIALWVVSSMGKTLDSFDLMMLASLILYMSGDILFASNRSKNGFMAGMAAFMAGNIIMIANLILITGVEQWDFLVLIVLLSIAAVSLVNRRMDFEGTGIVIAIYIAILCMMVSKAISLNWSLEGLSVFTLLFSAGAILYGVSDIVLAKNKFRYKDSRWLSPLNLTLYYSGIGLIAVFSSMIP